jgi:hypothetical protein
MNLNLLVDTGKSYKGDFIESWCKANLFNNRNAFQLLFDYWGRKNNCFPNKWTYYFVESHVDDFQNIIWKLKRDTDKSPKSDNQKEGI